MRSQTIKRAYDEGMYIITYGKSLEETIEKYNISKYTFYQDLKKLKKYYPYLYEEAKTVLEENNTDKVKNPSMVLNFSDDYIALSKNMAKIIVKNEMSLAEASKYFNLSEETIKNRINKCIKYVDKSLYDEVASQVNYRKKVEERVIKEAKYIIENEASITETAIHFNIDRNKLCDDIKIKLKNYDVNLYNKVNKILNGPVSPKIRKRCVKIACFMLKYNFSYQTAAKYFKISYTTAWIDINKKLPLVNKKLYLRVMKMLKSQN